MAFYWAFMGVMILERLSRLLMWTGYSISGQHVQFALTAVLSSSHFFVAFDTEFYVRVQKCLKLCTWDISEHIKMALMSDCISFHFSF